MNAASRLLDVPSSDPEDARRRKLLNIVLAGIAFLGIIAIVATTIAVMADVAGSPGEIATLYGINAGVLVGIVICFAINRFYSGVLAASLFLLLLIAAIVFSDSPDQVIGGRALFAFAIPVVMGSVLLRPYVSFVAAAASGAAIVLMGAIYGLVPNSQAIIGFFGIALVSWLSARSLETALRELRVINQELDQRVADRTHDLAQALTRERAEAGKNQAILEGIADGVIVFDRDTRATVANPAVTRLLERPPDDITGRSIVELMNGDVSREDQKTIADLLRDGSGSHGRLKFAWGYRTLSASFAPVLSSPGQISGTVGVFRDYTQEAEVDRMKSAFVGMVSHELRTPLNAILGFAEILHDSIYGPLLERQRTAAGRILTNTQRLLKIVNDLLDQALVESGRMTLEIGEFATTDLIDDLQSLVGQMARTKGLELKPTIAADMPARLQGDSQRLNQILVNLVTNALKFTERGHVAVGLYRVDRERWSMVVADTGPGIPPDEQSRVFEPFRQVESLTTRKHGGVGLGLSIVQRLVFLMGGEISLQSEVGRGTTFTVVLPIAPVNNSKSGD